MFLSLAASRSGCVGNTSTDSIGTSGLSTALRNEISSSRFCSAPNSIQNTMSNLGSSVCALAWCHALACRTVGHVVARVALYRLFRSAAPARERPLGYATHSVAHCPLTHPISLRDVANSREVRDSEQLSTALPCGAQIRPKSKRAASALGSAQNLPPIRQRRVQNDASCCEKGRIPR